MCKSASDFKQGLECLKPYSFACACYLDFLLPQSAVNHINLKQDAR